VRLWSTGAAIAAAIALVAPAQAIGAGMPPVMLTGGAAPGPSYKDPGSGRSSRVSALTHASVRSATPAKRAETLALPASGPGSLVQTGDDVVVDVRAATTSNAFPGALRAAGARVLSVSDQLRTVAAAVAPADLARVAAVGGVRNVRPELAPFRSAAGAGVKVGVISDSYDHDPSAPAHAADEWEAPAYRNTTCPTLPDSEQGCMNFGTAAGPANAQPFVLAPGGRLGLDLQWAQPCSA